MNFKRLLSFFLLCLGAVLTLLITSCGEKHKHVLSEWSVESAATCLSDGKLVRSCESCDFVEYSTVLKTGHTPVTDVAVAPTCTAEGKTEGSHCGVCGEILTAQETLQKAEHTPVTDAAVAPTCIAEGKTEGSHCDVCGDTLIAQEPLPKAKHSYGEGEVIDEATCLEAGSLKYTCTAKGCGYSYTEPYSLPTYTATELYDLAVNFVGEIVTYDKNGSELALGTGVVVSSDGRIITNYHVIDSAYSAKITIGDKTYPITSVLAYDVDIDLAVLKIDAEGIMYAKVCKNAPKTGETVYAIGSSKGLTNTYSQGIVTQAGREIEGVTYIQHDASITNGNSGGPLLNVYGEVIGINTFIVADSQNLNFAIFTSELDNLAYGDATTLSALYDRYCVAHDTLYAWLLKNQNSTEEGECAFNEISDNYWYSLAYDVEKDWLYIQGAWVRADGQILLVMIILPPNSLYDTVYAASYVYGESLQNVTAGVITPSEFTAETQINYESYEGLPELEEELMELYGEGLAYLLTWFDGATDTYGMGVDLADLGFTAFRVV